MTKEQAETMAQIVDGVARCVQVRGNVWAVWRRKSDGSVALIDSVGAELYRNEQDILVQVEQALTRLDKGTYGICERCGSEIDFARLKAIPYASLCIRCQQRMETPRGNGGRR